MSRRSVAVILLSVFAAGTRPVAAQDTTVAARDTAASRSLPAHHPFTGKVTLPGDLLRRLPIDDVRQALHLVPGVVLRGAALAPSGATAAAVRGGVAGEPSAYIDGAPVRLETLGVQGVALAPFMVAELGVETGVPDASVWDARGGVVSFLTPSGGTTIRGRLRAETDEMFGNGSTVGYNRFEGVVDGPVPGVPNLTFFAAGQLQGQRSQYRGVGAADQPTYVLGGLDTTVQFTDGSGSTVTVYVPRFAQWSGACDGCRGLQRPMDWTTNIRLLGKLRYDFGEASSISLTGLATGRQDRLFPGTDIGAPSLYRGEHMWSRLVVANLRHRLRGSDHNGPILHANLSYATDRAISGPLTTDSEVDSRDPPLGVELGTLQFTGLEVRPFPITREIVRNFRTDSGIRAAYRNRSDLLNGQIRRLNPFGLATGWPTSGLETELALLSERRVSGRASVDWSPVPRHQLMAGLDAAVTDIAFYQSPLLDQFLAEAFVAQPRRFGVFAADRFSAGRMTLDVGFRIERLDQGGELPTVPGVIFTHPQWNPAAATNDTAYANSVARVMTPMRAQTAFSPRVRAGYSLGHTTLRAVWGQHVEPPAYAALFAGANSDAFSGNTNFTQSFGRDVEFAEMSVLELGARHDFGSGVGVGLSLYRASPAFAYGFRFRPYPSPTSLTDTLQVNSLTRLDDGEVLGLDATLAWRPGNHQGVSLAYSFASVRRDDILIVGLVKRPAVNTHALSAVLTAAVPPGWREGTAIGALAAGLAGVAVFRTVSGVPYTRLLNQGIGYIVPDGAAFGQTAEAENSSRLPWTRHLDLRVNKAVRVGRLDLTAYADIRNLFNVRNTERLFAETGDVVNARHKANVVGDPLFFGFGTGEYLALWTEARDNGALAAGNTVDLRACATWSDPVSCVALSRVERRFGDGDGLYTQAEQERAFNTFYDSFAGPWWFSGPGRTARVGLELEF